MDRVTAEPTVFVVDDNFGVRRSLRSLIQAAGLRAETYASGEDFLRSFDAQRPGCLVLDVRLRSSSGLDLQEELRSRGTTLPIIVMTGYATVPASVRALKGGAVDFLEKPVRPKVLLERIHQAIAMDREAREAAARQAAVTARIASLTPRERQVMELLVAGKSSKEIAAGLRLSVRTVEGHRRRVLEKMEVSSAAHLVRTVLSVRDGASNA